MLEKDVKPSREQASKSYVSESLGWIEEIVRDRNLLTIYEADAADSDDSEELDSIILKVW